MLLENLSQSLRTLTLIWSVNAHNTLLCYHCIISSLAVVQYVAAWLPQVTGQWLPQKALGVLKLRSGLLPCGRDGTIVPSVTGGTCFTSVLAMKRPTVSTVGHCRSIRVHWVCMFRSWCVQQQRIYWVHRRNIYANKKAWSCLIGAFWNATMRALVALVQCDHEAISEPPIHWASPSALPALQAWIGADGRRGRLGGLLWEWQLVRAPATRGLAGSGSQASLHTFLK